MPAKTINIGLISFHQASPEMEWALGQFHAQQPALTNLRPGHYSFKYIEPGTQQEITYEFKLAQQVSFGVRASDPKQIRGYVFAATQDASDQVKNQIIGRLAPQLDGSLKFKQKKSFIKVQEADPSGNNEFLYSKKISYLHAKEAINYESEGKHYRSQVRKYTDGESLEELLAKKSPAEIGFENLLQISIKLLRAVEQLHACQILHLNIHPTNIIVDSQNENHVELINFKNAHTRGYVRGQTGTEKFRAPEQEAGAKTQDVHSDAYGVGAVLGEIWDMPLKDINEQDGRIIADCIQKLTSKDVATRASLAQAIQVFERLALQQQIVKKTQTLQSQETIDVMTAIEFGNATALSLQNQFRKLEELDIMNSSRFSSYKNLLQAELGRFKDNPLAFNEFIRVLDIGKLKNKSKQEIEKILEDTDAFFDESNFTNDLQKLNTRLNLAERVVNALPDTPANKMAAKNINGKLFLLKKNVSARLNNITRPIRTLDDFLKTTTKAQDITQEYLNKTEELEQSVGKILVTSSIQTLLDLSEKVERTINYLIRDIRVSLAEAEQVKALEVLHVQLQEKLALYEYLSVPHGLNTLRDFNDKIPSELSRIEKSFADIVDTLKSSLLKKSVQITQDIPLLKRNARCQRVLENVQGKCNVEMNAASLRQFFVSENPINSRIIDQLGHLYISVKKLFMDNLPRSFESIQVGLKLEELSKQARVKLVDKHSPIFKTLQNPDGHIELQILKNSAKAAIENYMLTALCRTQIFFWKPAIPANRIEKIQTLLRIINTPHASFESIKMSLNLEVQAMPANSLLANNLRAVLPKEPQPRKAVKVEMQNLV